MPPDVLVIAATPSRGEQLRAMLAARGHDVELVPWGEDWFEQALSSPALLIVLQLEPLAELDCGKLHELSLDGEGAPYLVVLGAGDIDQRVRIIASGADLCLPESTTTAELAARVAALLRRAKSRPPALSLPELDVRVDIAKRKAYCAGKELELTPYEFRTLRLMILQALKERQNRTFAAEPSVSADTVRELKAFLRALPSRKARPAAGSQQGSG